MARKRKRSKEPLVSTKTVDFLSSTNNSVDNDKHIVCNENKNKNNFANICHKKSHGANNWQLFRQSLLNNPQNTEPNKHNKEFHKEGGHPIGLTSSKQMSKASVGMSISEKRPLSTNNIDGKPKSVVDGNRALMPKQSNAEKNVLTKCIAMDCEMVGVEIGVNTNMLARISLVNLFGDCVYDKFVKPTEPVLDYRTRVSGVRSEDLENAEDFKTVQKEVSDILKGRILVGHALKNDLGVLFLSHPRQDMRDTSKFKKFREGRTPSLKKLAMKYLGVSIQDGEHSSVQDALAAMQLYRMFKKEWEASLRKPRYFKSKKQTTNSKLTVDRNI